jgi:Zn-finger nucleic acid-binding protein
MAKPTQTAYDLTSNRARMANMNKGTLDQVTSPELQQGEDVLPAGGGVELDSVTLKRLLAEVRNEEAFEPASYNRQHNRHNRTR